jgi:hypothetical protein
LGGIPFADFLPSPPVCLSAPWPPHPTSPYAKSGGTTIVLMLPSRMPRTPSSNPSTTSSSPTMNLCAQSARVSYVMCCSVGKLLTAVACPVSSGRSTRLSLRETPGSLCILQCRRWPPQDRHQPAGYSKSGLEAAACLKSGASTYRCLFEFHQSWLGNGRRTRSNGGLLAFALFLVGDGLSTNVVRRPA